MYGKVIAHAQELVVADAEFVVREAGRLRVIEEQRKNVHAGVVGRVVAWRGVAPRYPIQQMIEGAGICSSILEAKERLGRTVVSYNPYFAGYFYTKPDKQPIHKADVVGMYGNRSVRI